MGVSYLPEIVYVHLFIYSFVIFFKPCENANNNNNQRGLRDYDRKICSNEPSCHLMNETYLPRNRFTLKKRDCMCDAACVEYRDCCSDSTYYKTEEQNRPQPYHCSPTDKVYMKVTCPETWTDQDVSDKCAKALLPLTSTDVLPFMPVTNPTTNITYGNRYCAQCNADSDHKVWNEFPSCGKVAEEFLTSDGTIKNDAKLSVDFKKYRLEASEIWQNASHFHQGSGYFLSRYKERVFVCRMYRGLPKQLDKNVRQCVPSVIESCSGEAASDASAVRKCNSYTSIVFEKREQKKRYRNVDCAKCNGVSPSELTGCPVTLKD